ncbi:MAG: tetratricopeptide repeat protein, partial [Hyphomicrobiales bacterium]|nr:tetratricopeptide repeat protein [Hyphomicrobiales bacterium]
MRPSLRYLILAVLTGGILLATPLLPASAGVDFAVMGSVKRAMVDGRFDDAIALLEKTIANAGDLNDDVLADLWSVLADAYAKAERHDKAAEAWRKVIAHRIAARGADHPSLAGLYAAFADELERAGDPKAALDAANQALALDEKYLGTGNEAVRADLERLRDLANAAGNRVAVIKYRNRLRDFDTLLPPSSSESSNRGGTDPVPVTADYGEVDETQFARVRIYYGTDRAPTGILRPNDYYGGTRGELQFGTVEVSIPRVHKPGALEAPTVASFEVSENPERH